MSLTENNLKEAYSVWLDKAYRLMVSHEAQAVLANRDEALPKIAFLEQWGADASEFLSTAPASLVHEQAASMGLQYTPWVSVYVAWHCQSMRAATVLAHLLLVPLLAFRETVGGKVNMPDLIRAFPSGLPSAKFLEDQWSQHIKMSVELGLPDFLPHLRSFVKPE